MSAAILYSAKSTKDRHLSIPEQRDDCREMAAENGWEVVGDFADENFTAYSGNRGPGLAAAIALAKRTAAERGCEVYLVAQHTSRFARGDGARPDAPKALVELYHEWARSNVRGRLVENDTAMSSSVAAAVQGEADHSESKRKGKSVRKGLRRRARDRGKLAGGPRPYGYRWVGDRGEKRLEVVSAEVPVVVRIFNDSIAGVSQKSLAAALNRDGVPSATGKRWIQASVRRVLTNVIYIGQIRHMGETYVGEHDSIITDATWNAAAAIREGRADERRTTKNEHGDLRGAAKGTNNGGGRRPKGSHLMVKGLLRCSCGAAMVPRTVVNRQTPPTETYFCLARDQDVTACPQKPIRRDLIDGPLLDSLTTRYLDLDETRERLRARRSIDAEVAASTLAEAESERLRAAERLSRVVRDYQDGKLDVDDYREQRADLVEEQQAAEAAVLRAGSRVEDLRPSATDDVEEETLRRLAAMRATVLGGVEAAADVDALRVVLRQLFAEVALCRPLPGRGPQLVFSLRWETINLTALRDTPGDPISRVPLDFAVSEPVGLASGSEAAKDLAALFAPVPVGAR